MYDSNGELDPEDMDGEQAEYDKKIEELKNNTERFATAIVAEKYGEDESFAAENRQEEIAETVGEIKDYEHEIIGKIGDDPDRSVKECIQECFEEEEDENDSYPYDIDDKDELDDFLRSDK